MEGEDQQRLKLEEKIRVAMEGKEKRKKKRKKNRLHQRTCMENWRIHRFYSISFCKNWNAPDLSLLGVRTPITVAHERLSWIFSPPSIVSHSVASAETLIVLAWSMLTTREGERAASGQLLRTLETEIILRVWNYFLSSAREIDLHSVGKACKGRGAQTMEGCGSFLDVNLKKKWKEKKESA